MKIRHPAKDEGKKIVVVVGGGFGGLSLAKKLADEESVYVVLFDQRNHHLFQPLLYQVATAGLNPADISAPIRAQFSDAANVEVHWEKVVGADFQRQIVQSEKIELEYDFLVLACGAQHSYFNHPEWEEFAPGLKTIEQATEIRRRILSSFEHAENELDKEKQKSMLNFVVVGGGPTGVELAGAIADISRTVLIDDFKRIDPSQAKIVLIEAGERVLSTFDPDLSTKAERDLERLGVEVRLRSRVDNINENGLSAGDFFLPSKCIFWAAGVQAARLNFSPSVTLDPAGRVKVAEDLSLPEFSNVFIIGDMAHVTLSDGRMVPGLAPAAIQEGKHAARMILASIYGNERKPFKYLDKGQMATIGKSKAILQYGPLKLTGFVAWVAWIVVHLYYLIEFKNRLAVMAQWAWSYVFSKRGARLITSPKWKS